MADEGSVSNDWLVESLRMSVFLSHPDVESRIGTWKQMVGEEPDEVDLRPKQNQLRETGEFQGAVLTFAATMGRVDWLIGASTPKPGDEERKFTIGPYAEVCERFTALAERWLDESRGIGRIAFGAVLLCPVTDRGAAYDKISNLLQMDLGENPSNFSFQINRRRDSQSGVSELKINRLSKWSALERKVQEFTISDKLATLRSVEQGQFSARVELDINTAPEYDGQFDTTQSKVVFRELVEFGTEIARKGDIP